MPPVMGAAAFLMVEYVGISYIEVIKHAFLPAVISYIALVYIVHLEACKMGLEGMKKTITNTLAQRMQSFVFALLLMIVLTAVTYYGLGWGQVAADRLAWEGFAPVIIESREIARHDVTIISDFTGEQKEHIYYNDIFI